MQKVGSSFICVGKTMVDLTGNPLRFESIDDIWRENFDTIVKFTNVCFVNFFTQGVCMYA